MKNTRSFLLLTLSCFGCSQEPEHGRPFTPLYPIDWEPSKPLIYSTNVSATEPLFVNYLPENMPNSPPLVEQDILPRVELRNKTTNKLYSFAATLEDGEKIWESYIKFNVEPMEDGIHSLMLDSFQRQETIKYPFSISNSDAPALINIRYLTSTREGITPESTTIFMRFSELVYVNPDAIQLISRGAAYKDHSVYTNKEMPGNIVQMTINYEPGIAFDGTTLKFSIDTSEITSPISGKSLIPITESAFDLSDRFVYTDRMQRQGDVMVFEEELPPIGGGILWGVDLTPDGLRARAAGN